MVESTISHTRTSSSSPVRVLLVDDEEAFLELLLKMVSSFGCQCATAASGEAALEVLEREEFDILVTDMMMPGLDGMELLARCRSSYPEMDVLVLTGFSRLYSYTDVIDRGAADFVEKPVDSDELRAKLRRVVRERELRRSLNLRIAEVEEGKIANEEVKDYAERVKFFAYTVSHDLKTPAIAINGLTELLLRKYGDQLEGKAEKICRQIAKSSLQLVDLVENINQYIRAKETPLLIEQVDPGQIINAICREFRGEIEARNIELIMSDHFPVIRADKICLNRVFWNFIDNALKYGGESMRQIRILYQEDDGGHCFKVSDDGVGIATDETESIFRLFNRSRTTMAKKGTGLGLAIVREIAENHGGRAWVERGEPTGTTFCFSIGKGL